MFSLVLVCSIYVVFGVDKSMYEYGVQCLYVVRRSYWQVATQLTLHHSNVYELSFNSPIIVCCQANKYSSLLQSNSIYLAILLFSFYVTVFMFLTTSHLLARGCRHGHPFHNKRCQLSLLIHTIFLNLLNK